MSNFARIFIFTAIACALGASTAWAASPCDGMNRSLTNARKAALANAIAKQMQSSSVDVWNSFQYGGWSVLWVDPVDSENTFLFYANDPLTGHPVNTWGGIATRDEERGIRDWTIKNVPGIPPKLASCFAWYVTKGR